MNDDDDIDTSGIPDFAPEVPNSQWAKGTPELIKDISQLRDILIPKITRETIIAQLWLEANDRRSKSQPARIMALKLIAELKGYSEIHTDVMPENSDQLTEEEIKLVNKDFERSY